MSSAKYSVLFVCLGNLCRSPTAHAVMRAKVEDFGLNIFVDSAGTSAFHEGAKPDARTREVGENRGYNFKGLHSRSVERDDFEKFDLILAMDKDNLQSLLDRCPERYQYKLAMFLSYSDINETEVPDPYYGGRKGFELVLDMIEQGCDAIIDKIKVESIS